MPVLIDSHCHLDFPDFAPELGDVLNRARGAGVAKMICIGSGRDIASARAAVDLAERESDIFASVGVHPHDVARMTEADWVELEKLGRGPRVVGIGETGLDFYYDHSPRDAQDAAFRRFIAMSHAVKRPVICHIRDAHPESAEILRAENARDCGGVIHCFTGGPAEARVYLDLGFYISFSGIVTFKNAEPVRSAALLCPIDRILVETDAPYLAPIPFRGKRNEPAYVVKTAEFLAGLKGLSLDAVAEATTANAIRLFGLA